MSRIEVVPRKQSSRVDNGVDSDEDDTNTAVTSLITQELTGGLRNSKSTRFDYASLRFKSRRLERNYFAATSSAGEESAQIWMLKAVVDSTVLVLIATELSGGGYGRVVVAVVAVVLQLCIPFILLRYLRNRTVSNENKQRAKRLMFVLCNAAAMYVLWVDSLLLAHYMFVALPFFSWSYGALFSVIRSRLTGVLLVVLLFRFLYPNHYDYHDSLVNSTATTQTHTLINTSCDRTIVTVMFIWALLVTAISQRIKEFNDRRRFSLAQDFRRASEGQARLLHSFLPPWVAKRAKEDKAALSTFDSVLVMFVTIPEFDTVAKETTTGMAGFFKLLHLLTMRMDRLAYAQESLYKVENILGDFVLCSAVVAEGSTEDKDWMRLQKEVKEAVHLGMAFIELAKSFSHENRTLLRRPIELKIGLAIGPVVAGIVGTTRTFFRIFGDTVNTASRMQKVGGLNCICVPNEVAELCTALNFNVVDRGETEVKGKGWMKTHHVECTNESARQLRSQLATRAQQRRRLKQRDEMASLSKNKKSFIEAWGRAEVKGELGRRMSTVVEPVPIHGASRTDDLNAKAAIKNAKPGDAVGGVDVDEKEMEEYVLERRLKCTSFGMYWVLVSIIPSLGIALNCFGSWNDGSNETYCYCAALAACTCLFLLAWIRIRPEPVIRSVRNKVENFGTRVHRIIKICIAFLFVSLTVALVRHPHIFIVMLWTVLVTSIPSFRAKRTRGLPVIAVCLCVICAVLQSKMSTEERSSRSFDIERLVPHLCISMLSHAHAFHDMGRTAQKLRHEFWLKIRASSEIRSTAKLLESLLSAAVLQKLKGIGRTNSGGSGASGSSGDSSGDSDSEGRSSEDDSGDVDSDDIQQQPSSPAGRFGRLLLLNGESKRRVTSSAPSKRGSFRRNLLDLGKKRSRPRKLVPNFKKGTLQLATESYRVLILFADLVGFTAMSHGKAPETVVRALSSLYERFDQCVGKYKLHKVDTIGDAYVLAAGLEEATEDFQGQSDEALWRERTRRVLKCALDMIDEVASVRDSCEENRALGIRIGVHFGQVVGGIIGNVRPRFQVFGPALSRAEELESSSLTDRIHVSTRVARFARENFVLQPHHVFNVNRNGDAEKRNSDAGILAKTEAIATLSERRRSEFKTLISTIHGGSPTWLSLQHEDSNGAKTGESKDDDEERHNTFLVQGANETIVTYRMLRDELRRAFTEELSEFKGGDQGDELGAMRKRVVQMDDKIERMEAELEERESTIQELRAAVTRLLSNALGGDGVGSVASSKNK